MQRWAAFVAIVCASAFVAGCSSDGGPTVAARPEQTGSISWQPCGSVQCARLAVPLDPRRPGAQEITLALARRPATGKRVGVLFTNPGGPGGSGVDFVRDDAGVFPAAIRKSFDIVSWDPRGVGRSAPVQCTNDLDAFYAVDRSPDTSAEVAQNVEAARAFAASCNKGSGALLSHVSTADSVRDLEAIRAAMGVDRIDYVGFSYGTLLGAMYARAYPQHVRSMVLDGAVDPSLSYEQTAIDQAEGFERDLDNFLTHCRDEGCGFATGGDPFAAFDSLSSLIDAEPIPATVAGESRTLGPGEFDIGVASALYGGRDAWNALGRALAQAAQGRGDDLLAFSDDYTQRRPHGRYSNETAALYATSCLDSPSPTTLAAVRALAARVGRVAPRLGPATVWLGLPCTYWPVAPAGAAAPVHAPNAPPILVLGTTDDPATPLRWAEALTAQLQSAQLLTAIGDSHTSYGRGDVCVDGAVNRYLLKLQLPPDGKRCA